MNRNDFSNKAASAICTDRLACCQLDDALLSEISGGNDYEPGFIKVAPGKNEKYFCKKCGRSFKSFLDIRNHACAFALG